MLRFTPSGGHWEAKKRKIMAFFKKEKKKINSKWYPQSVTVGKPVTTDEVAKRIAVESTVAPADTFAVLKALGGVLGDYMAGGRTVKLDGVGTFYYTATAAGNGVATEKEVNASQITDVRVRFISEKHQSSSGKITTRSLISDNIFWEEWGGKTSTSGGNDPEDPTDPDGNPDDNPLG